MAEEKKEKQEQQKEISVDIEREAIGDLNDGFFGVGYLIFSDDLIPVFQIFEHLLFIKGIHV